MGQLAKSHPVARYQHRRISAVTNIGMCDQFT